MAKYRIKNPKTAAIAALVNAGGYLVWGWGHLGAKNLRSLKPKRILLMQLDEMGDVLLSTPAFDYLRRAFPEAHITVVVRKIGQLALANNPDIDQIIEIDVPRFGATIGGSSEDFASVKQAVAEIRKQDSQDFDLGIDLRADLRTIAILHKLKIPVRISQSIRSGGFWLTHTAPFLGEQHEVLRKLGIAKFATPSSKVKPSLPLKLPLSEEAAQKARLTLQENGIGKDDKYAVLHIFAGWQPKEWPHNRFAEIAKYLIKEYQLKTVIIGTKKEAERINKSALNIEDVHNVAGQTSVDETAAIIKMASIFVGNDSGPMHIASAVQTPTVALFGQNTPQRYGPWQNKNVAIYHQVECSPCPQTECQRQPRCMELIKVDEVKSAIDKLLSS
ncbi:glycosyltransferase family 9 protein [Patescibacteria group bacterium]